MLAVTHFLVTAIFLKLTKLRLDKTDLLSNKELLLCVILGGLPDIDGPLQALTYLFGSNAPLHRAFTHNIFIPIILLVIGIIVFYRNELVGKIFFLSSLAYGAHLVLDLLAGSMVLLFPLNSCWVGNSMCFRSVTCTSIFIAIDAVMLIGWLALRYYKTTIVKMN